MRLIFLVIGWILIKSVRAGDTKDQALSLQSLDELRSNLAKQDVSDQSKKLIELIFKDLSSLAGDSSKKHVNEQVYETNMTEQYQSQRSDDQNKPKQQQEYIIEHQAQALSQTVEYQSETHPQPQLEYQTEMPPNVQSEIENQKDREESQPQPVYEEHPPTVGTTPNLEEIYLGRCHYFINVLHAETCFLRPYLEHKINCTKSFEEFVYVVIGKDPCETTEEDYAKYLNIVAHPIPVNKSLFSSGVEYEPVHQCNNQF
jgi:hypothetical protein